MNQNVYFSKINLLMYKFIKMLILIKKKLAIGILLLECPKTISNTTIAYLSV